MLIRQKIILHLVQEAGGQIGRLKFAKCVFLFGQLSNSSAFYQFVPYRHGPYSFTLFREIDTLIQYGYLASTSNRLQLTGDVNLPPVAHSVKHDIERLYATYGALPQEDLLGRVYDNYPWFTVNAIPSENRRVERPQADCAIYTAGYERLQIDGFLNLLLERGVNQLIDVRNNPVSRRYGFHKSTLSGLCGKLEIKYRHVPEVGIPSQFRRDLRCSADYDKLFQKYENEWLPIQEVSIRQIAGWVQSRPSVLVCMEADPRCCHRSALARRVSDEIGLPIYDLRSDTCSPPKQEFLLPL